MTVHSENILNFYKINYDSITWKFIYNAIYV